MSLKYFLIGLTLVLSVSSGCKKKKNPEPDDPPIPSLTEILPGSWTVIQFQGAASLNLSGVEYQLVRTIKNGELNAVFSTGLSQMHFIGSGTFETSIKVSDQVLQTTDQQFSFSEQNTLYTVVSAGLNTLILAPGTAPGGETTAEIRRNSTTEIVFTIHQPENVENLGQIEFKNEYTLRKNQ